MGLKFRVWELGVWVSAGKLNKMGVSESTGPEHGVLPEGSLSSTSPAIWCPSIKKNLRDGLLEEVFAALLWVYLYMVYVQQVLPGRVSSSVFLASSFFDIMLETFPLPGCDALVILIKAQQDHG